MKGIKYIISFFIVFIGILIIGESHIFHLNNFYSKFHSTTMYIQQDTTDDEMVNDILNSAKSNDVEVFTFKRSPRSTFLTEFEIYGTSNAKEYINKNSNIFEGTYKSLFLGSIQFIFNDIENIPSMENVHDFYIIGSKDRVNQFKMDLIDKYAGNHPQEGYVSTESRNIIAGIWILIIGIILLLSFYDVIFQKKESLIKVSMGERISKIVLENILLDSFVYVVLFGIVLLILSKYTNVFFRFDISLLFFGVLILLNALLYLNLYFFNLKEVLSNVKGSKKLLSLNYSLKLVTAIITIFIISSNITLIFESYSLYKQKSFFEDHADYYYTRLEHRLIKNSDGSITDKSEEDAVMQGGFYKEFFEKFDATLIASTSGLLNEKGILVNKNAYAYLQSKIKELKDLSLNKDIYALLPKRLSGDAKIINKLNEAIKFYEGDNYLNHYEIIYYEDDVEVISIDENYIYGSELVKNPVIIYNNMTANTLNNGNDTDTRKITFVNDIMYKISDDEFNRFILEHDLADEIVTKTNVLEKYENNWNSAKRVLYINLMFSILVLFLEFIITSSIIKMEYEVNAIELSIMKVMGYGMLEKNRKIILMTVISSLLSIISTFIVASIMKLNGAKYLAIGGTIILVVELAVIVFYISKVENGKIQKILKGGNI